jgi:copper chaperone
MTQITLSVPDISCGHCKSSIEGAVAPMEGVGKAVVSIDDRNVDIEYDPSKVDLSTIVTAIDEQGYEVKGL